MIGRTTTDTFGEAFVQHFPMLNATAAGDVFCGGLAAKLADDATMFDVLHWVNALGIVAVRRVGALPSLQTTEDVKALLIEANKE